MTLPTNFILIDNQNRCLSSSHLLPGTESRIVIGNDRKHQRKRKRAAQ